MVMTDRMAGQRLTHVHLSWEISPLQRLFFFTLVAVHHSGHRQRILLLLCCPHTQTLHPTHAAPTPTQILTHTRCPSPSPQCTMVALAYPHAVELCATRPSFHRFASLSLTDTSSGLWQARQLFVAGPVSLHLVLADPVERFVQVVRLASFQGGVDSRASLGERCLGGGGAAGCVARHGLQAGPD